MRSCAMKLGTWILALASIAAGLSDLIWREFEPAHQPVHALADAIPHEPLLAALAAALLILGGGAILHPRTRRRGALALIVIYSVFALFWLPRFISVPKYLGFHFAVMNSVVNGIATQLIVVAAALLLYAGNNPLSLRTARWIFGLSALD